MRADLNRCDFLYISLKKAFGLYLIFLLLMTFGRVAFVLYFAPPGLYGQYAGDIAKAFYMGWKYDTIVASYLIAPFVALSILFALFKSRGLTKFFFRFSAVFYFFAALAVAFFVGADLGFYSYFQDHLNILFFGLIEDDTMALVTTLWKNYPVGLLSGGIAVLLLALFFGIRSVFSSIDQARSLFHPGPIKYVFMSLLSLVLLFGGARGGYGDLVLSPKYADFSTNMFVNQTAVNGIVTFEDAFKLRQKRSAAGSFLEREMGYKGIHQAFSDFLGIDTSPTDQSQLVSLLERRTAFNENLEALKPHVVVFVMESFGASWIRYNSENFDFLGPLKKHMREDILFENFISSDNGTIGSLMAIASNLPPRPGARYLSESRYMNTPLPSSAHKPFELKGYETSFVYGGKLGWRGIGKYFVRQGYHHVEGENIIREQLGLSGEIGTEWGLYDEHLFEHIARKLEGAKRPQFILVLSTSNHPPFEVPKTFVAPGKLEIPQELQSRITREEDLFLERFKAFQYANTVLSNFLDRVKGGELAQKTVVSFTGDHNFWGFMSYTGEENFLKFQVPFYVYAPESIRPESVDMTKLGSHEDIFPTLYNLALSDTPFLAFGENLFSENPSYAIGGNAYAGADGVVYKGQGFNWTKTPMVGGKADSSLDSVRRVYRSSVSVADFFLRQIFEQAKEKL